MTLIGMMETGVLCDFTKGLFKVFVVGWYNFFAVTA